MSTEHDVSDRVVNPRANKKKRVINIRLDQSIIDYFKALSEKHGIPYQTLINSFLSDCVAKKKTPKTIWS